MDILVGGGRWGGGGGDGVRVTCECRWKKEDIECPALLLLEV